MRTKPHFTPQIGARVKVWWYGDAKWYVARVVDTRATTRNARKRSIQGTDVLCAYELDGIKKWHALHNTRIGVFIAFLERANTRQHARESLAVLGDAKVPPRIADAESEVGSTDSAVDTSVGSATQVRVCCVCVCVFWGRKKKEGVRLRASAQVTASNVWGTADHVDGGDSVGTPHAATSATSATSASAVGRAVGRARAVHSDGHAKAMASVAKWVRAALRALGACADDLVIAPERVPNDALASKVHTQLAAWFQAGTRACDVGVECKRESDLERAPPQEILVKARSWMRAHVNAARAAVHMSEVHADWGKDLANRRADARDVNVARRDAKAANGSMYHHKHDLAPSPEEIVGMTRAGFVGDARVDEDVLNAIEAGMAAALYLPTGARGSELKKMHLQSLGHEVVPHEESGLRFVCLKLTAFETKTKEWHLNQIVAHSNAWRCGVGLFGLSVLVRVRRDGAPPFTMQTDERSWKVFGTNIGTLDRRLKDVFKVAGVRRQTGDPVTYLGRHHGTRLLQHAGGSSEGGAARRGHSNGTASFHYTECPLPDLLRLAGNNPVAPFVAAHLREHTDPLADAVLVHLFPELAAQEAALARRHAEVDAMRGERAERTRAEEHLLDQDKLARALRHACRVALCCLCARPRTWRRWLIIGEERSLWQDAATHRAVLALFAARDRKVLDAMNALADAVRRAEDAEIVASTEPSAPREQFASTLAAIEERNAAFLAEQRGMFEKLLAAVAPTAPPEPTANDADAKPRAPAPDNNALCPRAAAPPSPCGDAAARPLPSARVKHKRVEQDDVAHFSSWRKLADALEYARTTLAPLEREQGVAWRVRVFPRDETTGVAREDKSRDKQWRCYRDMASAIGAHMDAHACDESTAVSALQTRMTELGGHTKLLRALRPANAARGALVLGV